MSLSFLAPVMLWGALGAILPVIIHLIARRKARPLIFPAVMFIDSSVKSHRRYFKVKNILLLLLRILILAGFAFILARPLLKAPFLRYKPEDVVRAVIILDDSIASNYRVYLPERDETVTRFELAKERALEVLKTFERGSRAALVKTSHMRRLLLAREGESGALMLSARGETRDLEKIEREIKESRPGLAGGADILFCIKSAIRGMKGSGAKYNEIYVISDMSRSSWQASSKPIDEKELAEEGISIFLIDVGSPERTDFGISDVKIEPDVVQNSNILIRALARSQDQPGTRTVELFIDGTKRAQKQLIFEPFEEKEVIFPYRFRKPGFFQGRLAIAQDDAFAENNRRYFSVLVRRPLRVLIVKNNEAGLNDFQSEFFLTRALNPVTVREAAFMDVNVVPADELDFKKIKNAEVIFLLSPASVSESRWSQLKRFVFEGGGLIMSGSGVLGGGAAAGDLFRDIPEDLKPARTGRISGKPRVSGFEFSRRRHPLSAALRKSLPGGFAKMMIRRRIVLAGVNEDFTPVLYFKNGRSALLARTYGEGKVLFFALSFDDAWSDFPKRRAFLPFCHELVKFASRAAGGRLDYHVGQRIYFRVLPGLEQQKGPADSTILRVDSTAFENSRYMGELPGNFAVVSRVQKAYRETTRKVKCFSVNIDMSELKFERISAEELDELLPGALKAYGSHRRQLYALVREKRKGVEIYHYLIFALLAFLTVETFFSNRFYGRTKAG